VSKEQKPTDKAESPSPEQNTVSKEQKSSDDAVASSSSEQNMMLNLLTTPKYRAMSALYIIFRMCDNSTFLLIIILSLMNLIAGNEPQIIWPQGTDLALLLTIGLEVFYDVLLYTHQYWFLQRLSIHIGLTLFAIYGIIVTIKQYSPSDFTLVFRVLIVRFVAFCFEELVDIAIDGELHNDLLELSNLRSQQNQQQQQSKAENQSPKQNEITDEETEEDNPSTPLLGHNQVQRSTNLSPLTRCNQAVYGCKQKGETAAQCRVCGLLLLVDLQVCLQQVSLAG